MPAPASPPPAEQQPIGPHELLDLLSTLLDRPVGFHRALADVGGGATAGLFLSQALYWSRRTADPAGWFWKTQQDWQAETALTRREQETARARLRATGVLQERHAGVPAKLYFRVDLARLAALLRGVVGQDGGKRHPGAEAPAQDGGKRQPRMAGSAALAGREAPDQDGGKRQPLIGAETTPETTQRPQQQHAGASPTTAGASHPGDVVVHADQFIQALTERGVTAGVARCLVAGRAPAAVARQVEYYDHERATDPADPRLTPGRLRRRIEEDWAPPPGFVPPDEQGRRAAEEDWQRADTRANREAEDERCRRKRAATLAAVGATAEEQAIWHALAGNPIPLPLLFRGALFRAPRMGAGPVIILRTPGERDRAIGGGYAKERRELERRLRARYPAYARAALAGAPGTRYAAYDEYAAEPARSGDVGGSANG
jgi:hypothetical protein